MRHQIRVYNFKESSSSIPLSVAAWRKYEEKKNEGKAEKENKEETQQQMKCRAAQIIVYLHGSLRISVGLIASWASWAFFTFLKYFWGPADAKFCPYLPKAILSL